MAIRANAGLISDKMSGNPSVKEKNDNNTEIEKKITEVGKLSKKEDK